MSSYQVLAATSEALRDILWDAYNADTVLRPIVGNKQAIVFSNPTETARDSANRISLWLYQVTENEFLKNQPATRGNSHQSLQETPLALNLFFLVTPFGPSGGADHLLLGLAPFSCEVASKLARRGLHGHKLELRLRWEAGSAANTDGNSERITTITGLVARHSAPQ